MERGRRRFNQAGAVAALCALLPPGLVGAQPAAKGQGQGLALSRDRLDRLSRFLQEATQPGGHLGAVALVAHRGLLVFQQAHGHRDLGRREAMALDAIFRIYSMTKPIASVALLMLMEEGRLTLDDPVARYLPAFKNLQLLPADAAVGASGASGASGAAPRRAPARALTLRHLLTHTAGFATRGSDAAFPLLQAAAPSAATTLEDFARRMASVPLAAEPGSRFAYDGVNTEVMCRVLEVVAGVAFDAFLAQRVFLPLGMKDTGFSVPAPQRHRIADLSAVAPGGGLVRAPGPSSVVPGEPLNAYPSGAGGLYSTGDDFLRFCRMLLAGGALDGQRLLGRKTVELMRMNQLAHLDPITGLAPGEGFGLGVSVVTDPARRGRPATAGAYGWSGAATTYFTIDPQEQLVAILLMQHLPRDDAPGELPKPGVKFQNLVYQALE